MTLHPSAAAIRRIYRHPAVVLALYTLLALVFTYPLAFNLAAAVPNDIGDPLLNTWILAWVNHALLTNPANLFNANIFYPLPGTLAYSEHLFSTALVAMPVRLITTEPIVAYNFSLLLSFPLAAFGMYLLALRWTRRRDAAFIAGLIFGFAPYRFAAIAHLQLLTFQWLPFALLWLDRLMARGQPASRGRAALLAVLFMALQTLASWYLALYTALAAGLYVAARFLTGPQRRTQLTGPAGVALAVMLITGPFILPYLALISNLRQARPLSMALSLAAAPTDFAAAATFNRIFGPITAVLRQRPGFTEENTLFVGLAAPLLAAASLAVWRRYRPTPAARAARYALWATAAVALLLTFAAPYTLLASLFPPSTVVRVPPRWIIPALFALAGLSAFGYPRLKTRTLQPAALLLCAALITAEAWSAPLPLARVENRHTLNPAYYRLAGEDANFALVELPLHSAPAPEFPEVKRLYASTLGWWPLVNGYSGYTPPRQPELAAALATFPNSPAITALHRLASSGNRPVLVLVHPGEAPLSRSEWETATRWQAERNPALLPLGQFEGDYLYRLVLPNPARFAQPPRATFGPGKEIGLLAAGRGEPDFSLQAPALILYWQANAPLATGYTVFIHLRAADGFVHSQADGPPVSGHYPTTRWQAGEVIQDVHPLPAEDWSRIDHLAIGLYNPATGRRLPAFGPDGSRLADDALIIPLTP